MRKSVQAYAALRTGQDMDRPRGNFGAFYNRLMQPFKKNRAIHTKRFAAIRQAQEQARPAGNYGAFYFRKTKGK